MNLQYEQLQLIQNVAAILAIIFFIITVILFFALKIPAVIGDLTGITARKAIEQIRNQAEGTDEGNQTRGLGSRSKLTDKISPSGRIIQNPSTKIGGGMKTEKISTEKLVDNETTLLYAGDNETTVLGSNETTVLGGNETTVLGTPGGAGETTLLNSMTDSGETSKLGDTEALATEIPATPVAAPEVLATVFFEIEQEITFIHSQEVIA